MKTSISLTLMAIILFGLLIKAGMLLLEFLIAHPLVWQLLLYGLGAIALSAVVKIVPEALQRYREEQREARRARARQNLHQQLLETQAMLSQLRAEENQQSQQYQQLHSRLTALENIHPTRRARYEHYLTAVQDKLHQRRREINKVTAREAAIRTAQNELDFLELLQQVLPAPTTGETDDYYTALEREQILRDAERDAELALDKLEEAPLRVEPEKLRPTDLI